MKLIRGLGALSVLLAVLVGAPLALLAGGRYPSGWSGLMRPDDGSLWLVVLTAVGWLAWTAFTVATLVEAVQLVSGARFRLPLLGGLQQLSAGLLLAVLSLAPASTSASPAPAAVVAAVPQAEPDADRVYA
ncbi:MAG TPA: peptidoglycan-binding protein LysM, partial [Propionicimonas sp.]|nr:peptidoglycan-binding protein LysM [Propionicimonas sp.]